MGATSAVELSGSVETTVALSGSIVTENVVAGTCELRTDLKSEIYDGSMEVTPSAEEQELDTSGWVLKGDVVVHAIPYSEVINESGGNTVTIG